MSAGMLAIAAGYATAEAKEVFRAAAGEIIVETIANGLGLASLPEDLVETAMQKGRLVRVLADWCPPRPGYHLYYPSRRQPMPAFVLVVDALRHRAPMWLPQ